jgi:TPR repeat protein
VAACNLAWFYQRGVGLKKDLQKAREWNMKGAQHQNPDCEYALGVMAEDGELQPGGPAAATSWYKLAAQHGSTAAVDALRRLGRGE